MRKKFFPSNSQFWMIHLGCWTVVFVLFMFTSILTNNGGLAQVIGLILYIGLGIFGGLLFRYLFYRLGWHSKSVLNLLGITFLYVVVEGLIVGALATSYAYFVLANFPEGVTPVPPEQLSKYLTVVFIANVANITVFQAVWSSVYIIVATYRKSLKRETEALRLESSLKEAQLNILSSQLNPHFLFNALNNIRFMILKDTANAEDMLTHLSDLLRYALESSKAKKVTIEEELKIVDNFISLSQIQFNERLIFSKQVDPLAESYLMPPMMLQILMENAVKHGMDSLKDGGELVLKIDAKNNAIKISVRNQFSESTNLGRQPNLGIGLINIEQRLYLLYGVCGNLDTKVEGSYFVATLTLPKEIS